MKARKGVVAPAFGVPSTLPCNRAIAQMAFNKAAPVFTQLDVQFGDLPIKDVTYSNEVAGQPPPTLRIAREAVQWAQARGFNELWIACARPHLWRSRRDLEKALQEAGVDIDVYVCIEVFEKGVEWFSNTSTQLRTAYAWIWYLRDTILWLIPFWLYKKVAK